MNKSQQKNQQKKAKQKKGKSSRRNKTSALAPLSGRGRMKMLPDIKASVNKEYEGNDFQGFSSWRVLPASTQGGLRVKGRELVAIARTVSTTVNEQDVNFVSSQNTAFVTNRLPIHPLVCPRLANFAPIYEFYKFHTMKLNFIPSQSLTTNGTIFLGVNMEADDIVPANIARVMGNMCSSAFPIYSKGEIFVPDKLTRLKRFVCDTTQGTGSIVNQEVQAVLTGRYAGQSSTLLAATDTHFLYLEYDLEFYVPTLDLVTPVLKKIDGLFQGSVKDRSSSGDGIKKDSADLESSPEKEEERPLKGPGQSIAPIPRADLVQSDSKLGVDTKCQDGTSCTRIKPCGNCGCVISQCGCIRKELNW